MFLTGELFHDFAVNFSHNFYNCGPLHVFFFLMILHSNYIYSQIFHFVCRNSKLTQILKDSLGILMNTFSLVMMFDSCLLQAICCFSRWILN